MTQPRPQALLVRSLNNVLWLWDHTLGFVLAWLLITAVWIYRMTISPLLPASCRFYPSCSAYALDALRVHGSAKGSVLAGWRLLRCNPWNRGGIDPVPQYGAWRPDILPDGTPRPQP
ncbi:MAG: membrane protein insertion efficiency factor YidD [Actinomycetales bacterium]